MRCILVNSFSAIPYNIRLHKCETISERTRISIAAFVKYFLIFLILKEFNIAVRHLRFTCSLNVKVSPRKAPKYLMQVAPCTTSPAMSISVVSYTLVKLSITAEHNEFSF